MAASRMMEEGRWARAIGLYEGLHRRLGDRDAVMLNNLAWAYSARGDYEKALPLAEKAWTLDKDNPAHADPYGWLLFNSGRDHAKGLSPLHQASGGAPAHDHIPPHPHHTR